MTEMMKSKNFALVVGVALVLFAGSLASAAFNKSMLNDGAFSGPSGGGVLYSQLDDPSGSAFTDQSFEAPYAAYDGTGADDFAVTDGGGWDISTLNTPGSVTVPGSNPFFVSNAFLADAGGEPGAVLSDCDFPGNTAFTSAGDGDLSIEVECNAPAGTTWVSQTVRMDFNPFGQHFWATRATAAGTPAVWRNPGNGFGSGCLDWEPANSVCGQVGQDFLFELLGAPRTGQTNTGGVPAVGPFGVALMVLALGGGSAYVLRRRRA
jgi:hypothetical protein